MNRYPNFWGLHARPGLRLNWALAALPFVLTLIIYFVASDIRHRDNPQDKLLPSIGQMVNAVERVAFTPDRRSGDYLLWKDTYSSLQRIVIGVLSAAVLGLLLGLNMGLFAGFRAMGLAFVTFISMVPPLAILPIVFISFGVDEFAKIMLIFIGIFPVITRDIYMSVQKLPNEQITKALTLGASPLAVAYRIVLPQIMPRLVETVRLSLGAAWLFLIAAEAIASTDGLGYRIFLVRRYLAMDVILPYVFWITILGFSMDTLLRQWIKRRYQWYLARE